MDTYRSIAKLLNNQRHDQTTQHHATNKDEKHTASLGEQVILSQNDLKLLRNQKSKLS